jgi:N-acetylglutamate synthase-like GNAT family acetyltransferase
MTTPPEGLVLRRAVADDQALIHTMVIKEAELDPTDLHWSHFVIAELAGEVVGLGQIRPYKGCPELGSIYTRPDFEGRGIGGAVIGRLVADWPLPGPIYLECQSHNTTYYQRFGFREIPWYRAPMPLKLKSGVSNLLGLLFGIKVSAMQLDRPPADP